MVKRKEKIPEDDLKTINDSFKTSKGVQTIQKNVDGQSISSGKKNVNPIGFEFNDFRGKTLKHHKWVIPVGGRQTLIGAKGQKFDDIPEEKRKMVVWNKSDFE